MADNTKIEWADATLNAVNGCSVISPGCANCYAMRLAGTRMKHHPSRAWLTIGSKAGPVWNGEVRLSETALLQPLAWKRPRRIFWNAHGDLFHEAVPDEWIDRVFAVCALTPQHTHMILTKRSARMREYMQSDRALAICRQMDALTLGKVRSGTIESARHIARREPITNVCLGVSVEDQRRADERIPDLLATPAAVRFLSCEPLLGPVDATRIEHPARDGRVIDSLRGHHWSPPLGAEQISVQAGDSGWSPEKGISRIDWVIAGGESGAGARPMHPDWARSLRDQCAASGVPFHFKQWGEYHPSEQHEDCEMRRIMAFRSDGSEEWRPTEALGWQLNPGWQGMCMVGKKRAGRLLDGVEHNGVPA